MHNKAVNYKKLESICQDNQQWKNYTDKTKFISDYKTSIEKYFKNVGLKVRLGTKNDILN